MLNIYLKYPPNLIYSERVELVVRTSSGKELALQAFLTYELEKGSITNRTIIAVKESGLAKILLSATQVEAFNQFKEEIRNEQRRQGGATIGYKKIVVDILNIDYSEDRNAAIGKYGAVPVFMTSYSTNVEFNGVTFVGKVAITPDVKLGLGYARNEDTVISNKYFIQTLLVNPLLYFRKYFEDISDLFVAIENPNNINFKNYYQGNIAAALDYCRRVEAILGQSIKDKRKALRNNLSQLSKEDQDNLDVVDFLYSFIYLMINELYKLIGIQHKLERFEKDAAKLKLKADNLSMRANEVARIYDSYVAGETNEIDLNTGVENREPPIWVRRFAHFASFINLLKHILEKNEIETP